MGNYDDIIDMDPPMDPRHPRMSLHNRAAQFAPFDALTGFGGRIYETSRLTEERIELSEGEQQIIDQRLRQLEAHIREQPPVTVTYFVPDQTKDGGAYRTITSSAIKLDPYDERLFLEEELCIAFEDILTLEGDCFT